MLIGNKKDKENREVPFNQAMEYALKNNFGLMEVSARQGLGILESFNLLVRQIYSSIMQEVAENEAEMPAGAAQVDRDQLVRNSLLVRTQATVDSVVLKPEKHTQDSLDTSFRLSR